jgi:hypothetical protein
MRRVADRIALPSRASALFFVLVFVAGLITCAPPTFADDDLPSVALTSSAYAVAPTKSLHTNKKHALRRKKLRQVGRAVGRNNSAPQFTPSPTCTVTVTPICTATPTPVSTVTATPSCTPTAKPSCTVDQVKTATPTFTPTSSATATAKSTAVQTGTPTLTVASVKMRTFDFDSLRAW